MPWEDDEFVAARTKEFTDFAECAERGQKATGSGTVIVALKPDMRDPAVGEGVEWGVADMDEHVEVTAIGEMIVEQWEWELLLSFLCQVDQDDPVGPVGGAFVVPAVCEPLHKLGFHAAATADEARLDGSVPFYNPEIGCIVVRPKAA